MVGVGSEATLQNDDDTDQQEAEQVLDLTFARRGGAGPEKAAAAWAVERNSESEQVLLS